MNCYCECSAHWMLIAEDQPGARHPRSHARSRCVGRHRSPRNRRALTEDLSDFGAQRRDTRRRIVDRVTQYRRLEATTPLESRARVAARPVEVRSFHRAARGARRPTGASSHSRLGSRHPSTLALGFEQSHAAPHFGASASRFGGSPSSRSIGSVYSRYRMRSTIVAWIWSY